MFSIVFSLSTLYFLIISIINVILSSAKSICTVRYGRGINILMNVISYSFYVIVVKQTATLPLLATVIATAIANAIGVWLSYAILDYLQRDRLWKVEIVVPVHFIDDLRKDLDWIPYNYIEMGPKALFNVYCGTKADTAEVLKYSKKYKGKVFAAENKL